MVLPVSIWGTDSTGKAFHQLAYTLDISAGGGRLAGVQVPLKRGDIIGLRFKQRKARFSVVWTAKAEVGIQYLEGEKFIWIDLPEEEYRDWFQDGRGPGLPDQLPDSSQAGIEVPRQETRAERDAGSVAPSELVVEPNWAEELAATLETCLASLRSLGDAVNSAEMPLQVAQEFHAAAGHLRNTTWAVQQWVELQPESRDRSSVLESVYSERVRFATQICRKLVEEQQQLAVTVSSENREALVVAVQLLAEQLGLGKLGGPTDQGRRQLAAKRDPVSLLAGLNEEIRSTALPAEKTLDLMVERACSFADADGAAIALRDEEGMVCCASFGIAPLVGIRFSVSGALTGEAIATRQSVLCRDAENDERVDGALCRSMGLRSSAIAPIVARGSVMGVLQVFAGRPNAFDEASAFLLQHLAEFVASLEPNLRLEPDPR